jgi:glutamate-1-semialdehyde 2,1-aminomutase
VGVQTRSEAFIRSRPLHDEAVHVFPSGANSSLRAPLCMAAVDYVFGYLSDERLARAEALAVALGRALRSVASDHGLPLVVQRHGTAVFTAFSDAAALREYRDVVLRTDPKRWSHARSALLAEGVRVLERGLWYLSVAHNDDDVERAAEAFATVAACVEHNAPR